MGTTAVKTIAKRQGNGGTTVNSALGQNMVIEVGTIEFDSYATNGISVDFSIPDASVAAVLFPARGGYDYDFIKSTGKVKIYSGFVEVSNNKAIDSLNDVPYICFGFLR